MSVLDNLLGGEGTGASQNSNDFNSVIGTNPGFDLQASDVLHGETGEDGDTSSFTGIGDVGVGFSAPTVVGVSSSSESASFSDTSNDGGGLLGGIL